MGAHEGPDVSGSAPFIHTAEVTHAAPSSETNGEMSAGQDEKVAVRGVWMNGDKKAFVETPTMLVLSGSSPRTERLFGSEEEVQAFLTQEGYTFSHIRGAGVSGFSKEATRSQEEGTQVFVSEETLSRAEVATIEKEAEEIDREMAELRSTIETDLLELNEVLIAATNITVKEDTASQEIIKALDTIQSEATELREFVQMIAVLDDDADPIFDQAFIQNKRQNHQALRGYCEKIAALKERALRTVESLELLAAPGNVVHERAPREERVHGKKKKRNEGVVDPMATGMKIFVTDGDVPLPLLDTVPEQPPVPLTPEAPKDEGANFSWKKEVAVLLERPEGSGVRRVVRMIFQKEWQFFNQNIHRTGATVSHARKLVVWKATVVPRIEKQVIDYLVTLKDIDRERGGRIVLALREELREEDETKHSK